MNNEDGNDLRVLVVLEADTIVVTMPDSNYSIRGGLCDPKESPGEVSGPRLSRSSAQMATDTGRLQL